MAGEVPFQRVSESLITRPIARRRTDYSIRADNKLFLVRPDPFVPKDGVRSKVARYTGWGWLQGAQRSAPETIPVGSKVEIGPFGDRAWVRYGNRQYACTVIRQVLLAVPDEKRAQSLSPSDNNDSAEPQKPPRPAPRYDGTADAAEGAVDRGS